VLVRIRQPAEVPTAVGRQREARAHTAAAMPKVRQGVRGLA
jgi:hypothetical protein